MPTTRIDSNDNDDFETLAGQLKAGASIASLASARSLDVTQWHYDPYTLALVSETLDDGTVIKRTADLLGRPHLLQIKEGDPLAVVYEV